MRNEKNIQLCLQKQARLLQLTQLQLIKIVSIIFIWFFSFSGNSGYYISGNITYYDMREVETYLKIYNDFLNDYFGIRVSNVNIEVCNTVFEMRRRFKIPYWIGGFYYNGTIYLQPIKSLKKKKSLKKILFIELAHCYIEELNNKIPLWFNEGFSFYLYLDYFKVSFFYKKIFNSYEELINYNFKNKREFNIFLRTVIYFFVELEHRYGNGFLEKWLKYSPDMSIEESFNRLTGETIEKVFNEI